MFIPLQSHPRPGKILSWDIYSWIILVLSLTVTSLESLMYPSRKYELSIAWSQVVMARIAMSYISPSCLNLATGAQLLVQLCGLKPELCERKKKKKQTVREKVSLRAAVQLSHSPSSNVWMSHLNFITTACNSEVFMSICKLNLSRKSSTTLGYRV